MEAFKTPDCHEYDEGRQKEQLDAETKKPNTFWGSTDAQPFKLKAIHRNRFTRSFAHSSIASCIQCDKLKMEQITTRGTGKYENCDQEF